MKALIKFINAFNELIHLRFNALRLCPYVFIVSDKLAGCTRLLIKWLSASEVGILFEGYHIIHVTYVNAVGMMICNS